MVHICSWSGGKDSTASIILAHENKEPLDIIIFVEVMFDIVNNISGENPRHIHFIRNVAIPLFEKWGYKVVVLRSSTDYLELFHRKIERPRKHMDHKGKQFGFPIAGMCGVKRECKMRPINDFYKTLNESYVNYVGICTDEKERLISLHKDSSKVSLLEKYGYTEQMAKEKCQEYGLLSPCYELSDRGGCWFCPYAKLSEHREIRKIYPDVWKKFVSLEDEGNTAYRKWNVHKNISLHEIDRQLEWESKQLDLFEYFNRCSV